MSDTKLSTLALANAAGAFHYGLDAANVPRKLASLGFYNVKDFGALGNGSYNDRPNIQAAIDAAVGASYPGGTVFFPPGRYLINSALTLPGTSNAGVRFIGSGIGPYADYATGSVIHGDVNDYLLKVVHGPDTGNPDGMALGGIVNLGFCNTHVGGAVTSTDVTPGCVYMAGGLGTVIQGCSFHMAGDGIALFSSGQGTRVTGGLLSGGFTGNNNGAHKIGVWLYNGYIGDCKLYTFGIAVVAAASSGGFIAAENLNIEVSGCGFLIGKAPVPFVDVNSVSTIHLATDTCNVVSGSIRDTGMESIGDSDHSTPRSNIYISDASYLTIENARWVGYGQIGQTDYGLYAVGAKSCDFRNLDVEGYFTGAGIEIGGTGNTFHTVYTAIHPATVSPGPLWLTALQTKFAGDDANMFELCNAPDAALALPMNGPGAGTYFPFTPRSTGQSILCSDSPVSAWTGTVSNVGQPVTAAATANATTAAGNGTLHFASVPSWIQNGWQAFNLTNVNSSLASNTLVTGKSGTTVTISPVTSAGGTGVAVGDAIAFINTGGASTPNKALLRWTGSVAGNDGAWRIAG